MSASTLGPQVGQPVPTRALWVWTPPMQGQQQKVMSYPTVTGSPTKTGLERRDLEKYIQVVIQRYTNPPTPISDEDVNDWIRNAEDDIESETNVRLCQTWIAAPPAKSSTVTRLLNLNVAGNYQQLGVDYDLAEAGYDFFLKNGAMRDGV